MIACPKEVALDRAYEGLPDGGDQAARGGSRERSPNAPGRQFYFGGTKGAGSTRCGSRGDGGWVGAI
jgi:hypothetical protein